MIDALITGVLASDPIAKTARNGSVYCAARLRVPMGDAEAVFCLATAFEATARDALLALHRGDPVALACSLSISVWTPDSGGARPNLQGTVHAILSPYHVKRRRAEVANAQSVHEARGDAKHANGARASPLRGGSEFHDDDLGGAF